MAAGWKSNSKTLANTVDGLSGLFIATGSRVFGSFSTQLNPSVAATWITGVFETLWTKSRHEISPRSTRRNEFSTRQPTGADRSTSIVLTVDGFSKDFKVFNLFYFLFSSVPRYFSFSFISRDDWKTIEDNCCEIDDGWIYMLSWFGRNINIFRNNHVCF